MIFAALLRLKRSFQLIAFKRAYCIDHVVRYPALMRRAWMACHGRDAVESNRQHPLTAYTKAPIHAQIANHTFTGIQLANIAFSTLAFLPN